jgi:hypothetical protein
VCGGREHAGIELCQSSIDQSRGATASCDLVCLGADLVDWASAKAEKQGPRIVRGRFAQQRDGVGSLARVGALGGCLEQANGIGIVNGDTRAADIQPPGFNSAASPVV